MPSEERDIKKDIERNIEEDIGKNTETIRGCFIVIVKETLKFAILGVISLISIGTLMIYIMLKFFQIDVEIIALVAGVATAIIIFVIDIKKLHATEKMNYVSSKMMIMIIRKIMTRIKGKKKGV